jgi:hypothetical protein
MAISARGPIPVTLDDGQQAGDRLPLDVGLLGDVLQPQLQPKVPAECMQRMACMSEHCLYNLEKQWGENVEVGRFGPFEMHAADGMHVRTLLVQPRKQLSQKH